MKIKYVKLLSSILTVSVFLFLAFGSEESKSSNNNSEENKIEENKKTESQSNSLSNSEKTDEKSDYSQEENHQNMKEAMENISNPTYCSLCKGTGIEENRARGTGFGDDEYGRICPMCNGRGERSY